MLPIMPIMPIKPIMPIMPIKPIKPIMPTPQDLPLILTPSSPAPSLPCTPRCSPGRSPSLGGWMPRCP